MDDRWITFTEISHRLGVSRLTARGMAEEGVYPGLTVHFGFYRVERELFEKWAESINRKVKPGIGPRPKT